MLVLIILKKKSSDGGAAKIIGKHCTVCLKEILKRWYNFLGNNRFKDLSDI